MATIAQCSNWIDVSERYFHSLIESGAITRRPRGQYDKKIVLWEYLNHLRAKAATKRDREVFQLGIAYANTCQALAECDPDNWAIDGRKSD
jgi:hypothetical protein